MSSRPRPFSSSQVLISSFVSSGLIESDTSCADNRLRNETSAYLFLFPQISKKNHKIVAYSYEHNELYVANFISNSNQFDVWQLTVSEYR